ncbi:hypothetical protein F4777DRAFT_558900 [Nemania sp. FL0916]|nr:hypothetical protein F4777DRAFT_558900 [Nemania sp. FL0916]
MNNSRPTAYTPLETLFLFQLLSKYGFINDSFERIAQELQSIPLVVEQKEHNAGRLTPEALQHLALQLLSEEYRSEAEAAADRGANGLSPASKKRKLASPPLPTLKDAHEHPEKLPILIDRLYARFRDELVRQIREDEGLYQQRQREIDEIQRGQWDEKIRQEQRAHEASSNGVIDENERDGRPPTSKGHAAGSPTATLTPLVAPIQAPSPIQNQDQGQAPATTHAPPKAAPSPPAAAQAPPQAPLASAIVQAPEAASQVPATSPAQPKIPELPKRIETTPIPVPVPVPVRVPSPRVASTPVPALQPLHDKRPLQPSPSHTPGTITAPATMVRAANEQRQFTPEIRPPPEPARITNGTASVLQPPQIAPNYGQRPASTTQLQLPDGAQRHENLPNAKSPVLGQQTQAQTQAQAQAQLKWEPPYQPHHPPHQTPVPSPRLPYPSSMPKPVGYPPQGSPGPSQAPQHVPQPQNFPGGRQTPGHSVPQARFPTPGTAAPSAPVLLPPQHTSHVPPSLRPLPLNATPDGNGQDGPSQPQRPFSTPVVASPTSIIPGPAYPQPQATAVLPPSTPIRPPPGPTATHPTIAIPKLITHPIHPPQLPTGTRLSQPQAHSRPGPAHQSTVPTTPSQLQHPRSTSRSHGAQLHQQPKAVGSSDGSQRPPIPVQTPVSTPQLSRPPSIFQQAQTPSGVSDPIYVIRGHGTKWVSTPTPSTPRVKDMESYFDTESPAFEPLSPPTQPAHLPKRSPNTEKRDVGKPATKIDTARPRGRPPRVAQKPDKTLEAEENSAEPDPPVPAIKNEVATPLTLQEAMNTAANEALRGHLPAAANTLSKRKRQDSPPQQGPSTPATHVLWTRAFHKISMTALDQIIGHRYANMFSSPIKPRLAPAYYDIILRPQNLKGIQKAITAGSKAAAAVVATMPGIDPNMPTVLLPISIDLVPPRGIINIAQLERELIHMFANAIMYNNDPLKGIGPSFFRSYQSNPEEGEDLRGYEFDENGVVKETRNMFAEVEKLLGDLRNEVVPRAQAIGSGSRSVSAAVGEPTIMDEEGGDEQAGDAKRRRIRG